MRLFADHTFPFDFRIACAVIVNVPVARAELRGLLAAVLDADVIPQDEAAEDRIRLFAQPRGGAPRSGCRR